MFCYLWFCRQDSMKIPASRNMSGKYLIVFAKRKSSGQDRKIPASRKKYEWKILLTTCTQANKVGLKYSWWPEATTPLDSAMHQKLQTITKPNTFLTANLIRWKHLQVLFAPNPNESMSIYIYIYIWIWWWN